MEAPQRETFKDPVAQRLADVGEGKPAALKFMAHVAVALDEYVAQVATGDPAKVIDALAEIGMTGTAALVRQAVERTDTPHPAPPA